MSMYMIRWPSFVVVACLIDPSRRVEKLAVLFGVFACFAGSRSLARSVRLSVQPSVYATIYR